MKRLSSLILVVVALASVCRASVPLEITITRVTRGVAYVNKAGKDITPFLVCAVVKTIGNDPIDVAHLTCDLWTTIRAEPSAEYSVGIWAA